VSKKKKTEVEKAQAKFDKVMSTLDDTIAKLGYISHDIDDAMVDLCDAIRNSKETE